MDALIHLSLFPLFLSTMDGEKETKVVAMKAFISRLPFFLRIFELSYLERKNEGEKKREYEEIQKLGKKEKDVMRWKLERRL